VSGNDKNQVKTNQDSAAVKDIKSSTNSNKNQELNQVSYNIDQILNETGDTKNKTGLGNNSEGTMPGGDPLSGANWTSQPRKTLSYPDIQSKIPDKYKKKGLSYSLTAKIDFDRNGLAVFVDIINSSGDSGIDNILFTELHKIRVEPIQENIIVEITKVFTINLK
jgi:hypothetical protein